MLDSGKPPKVWMRIGILFRLTKSFESKMKTEVRVFSEIAKIVLFILKLAIFELIFTFRSKI